MESPGTPAPAPAPTPTSQPEPPKSAAHRARGWSSIVKVVVAAVVVVGLAVGGGLLLRNTDGDEPIALGAVEVQIRRVLQLPTYEHVYRDIVYYGREERFLGIRTVDQRVLFAIDIRVQTGVDLRAGFELIRSADDPTALFVRMPAAQVLTVDADEASISQYFVRERGGSITLRQIAEQIDAVKNQAELDAVARGALDHATHNAQGIVKTLLQVLGFEEIRFLPPLQRDAPEVRG